MLQDSDWDEDDDPFQAHTGLVVFPDRVTVASARELSRILRLDISGHQYSIFDMSRTIYLDDSAAATMGDLVGVAMARQSRTIIIAGMNQSVSDTRFAQWECWTGFPMRTLLQMWKRPSE